MKKKTNKHAASTPRFGETLGFSQLAGLAEELNWLRKVPPKVTKTTGRREGDILGFVRGLRLSARVTYFLRERLSQLPYEVSWGHVLSEDQACCSPECDIIIHTKGHHVRWNGSAHPIMDFCFIREPAAKVVVSCKSVLSSIDARHPRMLKEFGVKKVFLFAECCKDTRFSALKKTAKRAGYAGLCCLYFFKADGFSITKDELLYADFVNSVSKAVEK